MSATDASSPLPPISHILETCLYVRDVAASVKFYKETFQMDPFLQSPRMAGFSLGPTTLLLFQLGLTAADIQTPTGLIPGHGPTSPILSTLLPNPNPNTNTNTNTSTETEPAKLKQHFCFAVPQPSDVTAYDNHFQKLGVKITGRMEWERGGRSVYFEDGDGHVGEVGSRGIWAHY